MENAAENKILARVKKMLALGNDAAATEAERETALRMAYNLLAKHNLDMADLPADMNDEAREAQEFTMCGDIYIRSLCGAIARLFFCKYFFTRKGAGKDGHTFIGRQSNVVTARYMSEYIVKSVRKEAAKRYKTATTPEGRSFGVGATNAIVTRVRELQAADSADTKAGSALVLVKHSTAEQAANDAFALTVLGVEVHKTKARADNSLVGNAFRDGKQYGKTVSLNQQVAANAVPKRTAIK